MIRKIIGTISLVDTEDGAAVAVAVMDQKEGTERCELKSAQQLLANTPSLDGATVTADPLHCQKETAWCEAEPLATGFPYSRTILRVASRRTIKKTGQSSVETRYYLSSQEAGERSAEGWVELSRAHWAGVENRNRWRRDATLGEDGTRLQQPRALANLALLRSVGLRLLAADGGEGWLPEQRERLAANIPALLRLILTPL